jgi:alpha-ribazole phosphatase CobZ
MELKLCNDDFNLLVNQDNIILEGKDDFILFGSSRNFNGCGKYRSVSNHVLEQVIKWKDGDEQGYIDDLVVKKELATPASVILTPTPCIKNEVITSGPVSAIISIFKKPNSASIFGNISISTMVVVNQVLNQGILIKLILDIQKTLSTVLRDSGVDSEKYGKSNSPSIVIICKGVNEAGDLDKIQEIEDLTRECVKKAASLALTELGYPPSITQILSAAGVEIDDLVAAGAELLVGVDDTPELRAKIRGQLIKSLQDINVISLVLAGIRVENDYQHHRVQDVEVDDDPAYLYADEVLGMAIANQIAGTKAIFNFKRYDEYKPGIISRLGPMLDDVCAGLVAGCMSRIFEE